MNAKHLLVITPTLELFIEWLMKNNVSHDDPRIRHVHTREQAYGYVDFIAVNYCNARRDVDCWGALMVVHMMEKEGRGQLVPNGSPLLEQFKRHPKWPATEAITKESFDAMIARVFKKRDTVRDTGPRVDPLVLSRNGIPFYYDGDMVIVSSEGMKRAREVGAVMPS